MANMFNKEDVVLFEKVLEGFDNHLVMAENVERFDIDGQTLERSGGSIWRPVPYIDTINYGNDQTGNFENVTQLAVPISGVIHPVSAKGFEAGDLRDKTQLKRVADSAKQRLAHELDLKILEAVRDYGSIFVKRSSAVSGFDDVAEIDAALNELGIAVTGNGSERRILALNSRDYNSMASDLAAREMMQGAPTEAYRRAFVGMISGIDTFKMNYSLALTAAAASSVTINGANQYYTPQAYTVSASGQRANIDNRFQDLAITVGSGTVKVGDAFTIANVYSVNHINKVSTGQLKTFRIVEIVSGAGGTGTVKITPAIVSGGGGSQAERAYQNVDSTPANGAAITFLNTVTKQINPFWVKGAIEFTPETSGVESESNVGAGIMSEVTSSGIRLEMIKQFDIDTKTFKYRWETLFRVTPLQPEMMGLEMFSQT